MIALLIRHGSSHRPEVLGRRPGAGLTPAGRREVQALESLLRQWKLEAIYSSPLKRAVETAALLGRATGVPVQANPALTEMNFGEWEGKTPAELHHLPAWQEFNTHRGGTGCPGGESMREVQARIISLLEAMHRNFPQSAAAFVSHAEVIRAALCHYGDIPLDNFQAVDVAPASLHVVDVRFRRTAAIR